MKEHVIDTLLQIAEGYGRLTAQELGLIKRSELGTKRFAKCLQCKTDGKATLLDDHCTLCTCKMKAKVLVPGASCPKSLW